MNDNNIDQTQEGASNPKKIEKESTVSEEKTNTTENDKTNNLEKNNPEKGKNTIDENTNKDEQLVSQLNLKDIVNHLLIFDFFEDYKRVEQGKEVLDFWKNKITTLASTLDNFVFSFTEILLQSKYGIEKPKNLITFPCSIKIDEQILSAIQIREGLSAINDEDGHEALSIVQGLNIRKPDEYDFILTNALAVGEASKYYKKVLDTLVLNLKIMHRQQKRLLSLLLDIIHADQLLEIVYSQYSYLIDKLRLYVEDSTEHFLNEEKLKEIAQTHYLKIKEYEDKYGKSGVMPKILKNFNKNMDTGLFNVLNSLIAIKHYFSEQDTDSDISSTDYQGFSGLLTDLIVKTKSYLADELGIEMIETQRGEDFNTDVHNAYVEPEPDKELEQGKVKQVVAYGFKMGDIILKPTDVILVKNN